MPLPTTKHFYLAGQERVIHAGWGKCSQVKKSSPIYFILTRSALSCYTQSDIKKKKDKPRMRIITGTIGGHSIVTSKKGYVLIFSGRNKITGSTSYFEITCDDSDLVLEWYLVLVSEYDGLSGALKPSPIPASIRIPGKFSHYLKKPDTSGTANLVSYVPLQPPKAVIIPNLYSNKPLMNAPATYIPVPPMQPTMQAPIPMVVQSQAVQPPPMPITYSPNPIPTTNNMIPMPMLPPPPQQQQYAPLPANIEYPRF